MVEFKIDVYSSSADFRVVLTGWVPSVPCGCLVQDSQVFVPAPSLEMFKVKMNQALGNLI